MHKSVEELRRKLKLLLAGGLFCVLLMGAAAGSFAGLAAGISALSNADKPLPVVMVTPPETEQPPAAYTNPNPSYEVPYGYDVPQTESTIPSDALSQQLDRMQSPIGDAVDTGGVLLGNRVQDAFGNMLAGVLKTLFLERPDGTSSVREGSGQNG
jgi:hypothetical protein